MDRFLLRKISDLSEALKARGEDAVWIKSGRNISWLMGGRPHIGMFTSEAAVSLVLARGELHLIADNVEKPRIMAEEFKTVGVRLVEIEWHRKPEEGRILLEIFGKGIKTDDLFEEEFRKLRMNLNEQEISAMRALGALTAACMEEACYLARPGMSENKVASLLSGAATRNALEASVLLVAADERISKYRHPLPTAKVVERKAMLSLVCRKGGLYVGLTRFVSFEKADAAFLAKQRSLNSIFANLVARTRPGVDIKDVFSALVDDYEAEGFPGEWRNHHQGGVIGYSARELKAMPGFSFEVKQGQAYAWNPTVPGFKVEDTYLVGLHSNELVTATPNLPCLSVKAGETVVAISDVLYKAQ